MIQRIDLPLPWELGQINVYRIPFEDGAMLVDCGINTPEAFTALEPHLDAIRLILLTHTHPDHMGLAPRLVQLTGARLAMHRREFEQLEKWMDAIEQDHDFDHGLEIAATPPELAERVRNSFHEVHTAFARLNPDILLDGGEQLGPAEVIWTPGHSPGHVCLKLGPDLISGDHLLENITPNIGWREGEDTLGHFLDSLDRIAPLDLDTIYPAHGEPFHNHQAWIIQTKAHHAERCSEIETALAIHPRTAHQLVAILWPRRLSAFHYRFAVYEVLAHLEYLRRKGRVAFDSGNQWSCIISQ